jgi:hypothetical protein
MHHAPRIELHTRVPLAANGAMSPDRAPTAAWS